MDVASTTFTLMKEAYRGILFIRTVIENAKNMEADQKDIKSQIDEEIGFLDTCKLLLFDDNGQFRQPRGLPIACFEKKVENTARKLLQAMSEYTTIAGKYEVPESKGWEHVVGDSKSMMECMAVKVHRVQQKVKDIKKRYLDWSVFDRERVLEVLRVYTGHAHELRETLSHIVLICLAAGDTWIKEVLEKQSRDRWLQEAAARRLLGLQDPPADFDALDWKRIRPTSQQSTTSPDIVHGKYDDHSGQTHSVIVEYRSYDPVLRDAPSTVFPELKAPIRKLAWAMQSAFTKAEDAGRPSTLRVLPCLGYVDDMKHWRIGFVYRCAQLHTGDEGKEHATLHSLISQYTVGQSSAGQSTVGQSTVGQSTVGQSTVGQSTVGQSTVGGEGQSAVRQDHPLPKPSLGERFRISAELAATVSGIHGFGWVHKGISSHSIIMSSGTNGDGLIPHLIGWCYARQQNGETMKVNPVEDRASDLYRHPKRQGHPSDRFTIRHDIYSLGVVLLAVALWETADELCKGVDHPIKIGEILLKRARDTVPWLMGERYAEAVRRCLEGDFDIPGDHNREALLGLAFRDFVVDVIAAGRAL